MGVIGEKLKERGWTKSHLELLSIGITLLFFTVLIWFVFESALLEGKCKATLLTGERVKYDPNEPPNFSEQLVYVNISYDNCTQETVCYQRWVCNYTWDEEPWLVSCWAGTC